jgi:hypothetical protein
MQTGRCSKILIILAGGLPFSILVPVYLSCLSHDWIFSSPESREAEQRWLHVTTSLNRLRGICIQHWITEETHRAIGERGMTI